MSQRIVNIKMQADASGLMQGFNKASDAAAGLESKVKQSATSNRQEWATVGSTLTAVGVAIVGVGAAALKTGIQYNTLQQTSRAALTTITGSAQAANAQMDKLDEFARNSPFSKAVFIEAQQQLLGFGMEAERVLPTLDAIQNAVAATGGSNQDIAELTRIIAQLAGGVKFSAETLNQFGTRGVDAASIIGAAMGKTGAQIREEITKGTLDADLALTALTDGMQEKFGGAADNVKQTFAGSMDRVKAAWRDFASELAKPLVDPNGGGALIDLLNWTADMMRGFESLPGPVKNTVSALTGLVGVGSLLGGTFMLGLPKVLEFNAALRTIGFTASGLRGGLSSVARFLTNPWVLAFAAAAAAMTVLNNHIEDGRASQTKIAASINSTKSAAESLAVAAEMSAWENFWKGGDVLQENLDNLGEVLDRTAGRANNFWSHAWYGTTNKDIATLEALERYGEGLDALDFDRAAEGFQKLATEKELTREQTELMLARMPTFKAQLEEQALAAGVSADESNLLKIALGELEVVTDDAGESMVRAAGSGEIQVKSLMELQGAADEVNDAVSALADEIMNFGSANIDAGRAALKFEEELDTLKKQVADSKATLDRSTEAGRANEESLYDMADATNRAASAAQAAGEDQETVNRILGRGRDALIRAAEAYGMSRKEAERFADQVSATPDTVSTHIRLTGYQSAITELNQLTASRTVGVRVQTDYGSGAMTRAYGGTVGYAFGGTIPGAANGMTLGVGGGVNRGTVYGAGTAKSDSVLVRLSKGEEVIQQPYAAENRQLLKAINRGEFHQGMMQPQVVSSGQSGPVQVSLAGAVLKASIDGRPIDVMIHSQIASGLRGGSASVLDRQLGLPRR